MELIGWLMRRTPRAEDPVILTPADPWGGIAISLDPTIPDAPETTAPDATAPEPPAPAIAAERIELEPLFTVIDYTDSAGHQTRRRITMIHIRPTAGSYVLVARCHERQAIRTFRLDRIECFIEPDGEVIAPDDFFRDFLDIDLSQLLATLPRPRPGRRSHETSLFTRLRRELAPGLVVLTAAARADNFLHPEEVDRIMLHTERAALRLLEAGRLPRLPQVEDFDRLGQLILRTRPTRDELHGALAQLGAWDDSRVRTLSRSVLAVIAADGVIVPAELDFAAEVQRLLRLDSA